MQNAEYQSFISVIRIVGKWNGFHGYVTCRLTDFRYDNNY